MAISVADNFSYQGGKPLDARMKYDSVANMVAVPAANLYDGCFAYVTAEQKYYSYDSANDTDPTLGKWREYSGGGGGDVDPMPAEDMDDILTPLPGVMARSIYNSRFNRSDMYDTNEVLIGKWIDGKPLYQKTVDCGAMPNNTTKTVSLGLAKDSVVIVNCIAFSKFGNQYVTLPYIVQSSIWNAYFEINDNSGSNNLYAQIVTSANWSSATAYVTIQYTKTGDGTTKVDFDTDYSTDETIVGRWIDGKPLYQKTVDCGNLPNNSSKTILHGIQNIAKVLSIKAVAINPTSNTFLHIPAVGVSADVIQYQIGIDVNLNEIHITTGADRSSYNAYVTLQYTKTTD